MLTGVLLTAGCFGGGGSSWGGIFGAIVVIAVITASGGGATALPFAADIKKPAAEIRFARANKFLGRVRLVGHPTPSPVELDISDDQKTLTLNTQLSVGAGKSDVLIEVVPEGSDNPILKAIAGAEVGAGETEKIAPLVNFDTTAKVLAYEQWDHNDTSSFSDFNPDEAAVASLAKDLMAAVPLNDANEIAPPADFTYSDTIIASATEIAEATEPPPSSTPVPATRYLDVDVTQPSTQTELAVSESLKTLVQGYRVSLQPSLRSSDAPAGVPVLGSNEAININWLMGNLLAALPTGGNINTGVLIDSADSKNYKYQVATYTAANNTLEVSLVKTSYASWPAEPVKYLAQTIKITNCEATVTNGILEKLTLKPGAVVETKEYSQSEVLESTVKITLQSGAEIELSTNLVADTSYVALFTSGTWSSGLVKSLSGTETLKVTFNGPAVFDVSFKEDTETITGSISLNNLTGSYSLTSNVAIGKRASKNGDNEPVVNPDAPVVKEYLNGETHSNSLVFANNSLNLLVNASWNNGTVTLENGVIEIKNLVKKAAAAGEADANYSLSGSTANMLVKYNGSDYAQYGYIYSLQFQISNMSFDPANPDAAGNGTSIVVTKTNSDRSVDTLSYVIQNQMPVLQPGSSNFAGGNEKITVANGVTTVEGSIVIARSSTAPESERLQLTYTSSKNQAGAINTRVVLRQGSHVRTMFFTRQTTRTVAGKLYEGELASESGTETGSFSVDAYGAGILSLGGQSYPFRVNL